MFCAQYSCVPLKKLKDALYYHNGCRMAKYNENWYLIQPLLIVVNFRVHMDLFFRNYNTSGACEIPFGVSFDICVPKSCGGSADLLTLSRECNNTI